MKKICKKKSNFILDVVYAIGSKTVDSKCLWWFNQPKVPKALKEMKK